VSKLLPSISQTTVKSVQKEFSKILNLQGTDVSKRGSCIKISGIRPWLASTVHAAGDILRKPINSWTSRNPAFKADEIPILKLTKTWSKNLESDQEAQLKLRNSQKSTMEDHSYLENKSEASRELGIAVSFDGWLAANLLAENDGHIKGWAKWILQRMNMVKWQGTTKARGDAWAIEDTDIWMNVIVKDRTIGIRLIACTCPWLALKKWRSLVLTTKGRLLYCHLVQWLAVNSSNIWKNMVAKESQSRWWYLCYTGNHWLLWWLIWIISYSLNLPRSQFPFFQHCLCITCNSWGG